MAAVKKGAYVRLVSKKKNEQLEGRVNYSYKAPSGAEVVSITTPTGLIRVVNIAEFVVTILPLLDRIIEWLAEKIKLFRKRDKGE